MSYRSYVPSYKSNLSTSYKSGSVSAYSSKDDVNDTKSSPRFAPITTPAAYRPAYSGGTYRSIPIKRDTTYVPFKYTPAEDKTIKDINVCNHKGSRYSTSTSNLTRYGRSRDPSPSTSSFTTARSRDPSPNLSVNIRSRSRDPSPAALDLGKTNRPSAMNYPTYKMGQNRHASSGYNSRLATNSYPRANTATLAERALSYMTASEIKARPKPQREQIDQKVKTEAINVDCAGLNERIDSRPTESANVTVHVVSRGTSPTPPGITTVSRTRRFDIAKTIEKTIQRSTKKIEYLDKDMQSDRLDDSTKYLRYNSNSSRTPSSSWSENRSLKHPVNSTSSYTSNSSKLETDSEKNNKSIEQKIQQNRPSLKKSDSKTKISSSKSHSKQKSIENLNIASTRPPTVPKSDSPTKSTSSSAKESSKLPNKDFRKSALNIGPTDRPRKSRTPSTSTDSEENQQPRGTLQIVQHLERSSSVGSETSSHSTTTNTSADENKHQRCHKLKSTKIPSSIFTSQKNDEEKQRNEINNTTMMKTKQKTDLKIDSHFIGEKTDENNSHNEKYDNEIFREESFQNKKQPPTPPTQTVASTAALLKYLKINDGQQESSGFTDDSYIHNNNNNQYTNKNDFNTKNNDNKSKLVRKLGTISSFLAAQIQEDDDSENEPFLFDNNSSSNSISENFNKESCSTIATKSNTKSKLSKNNSNETRNKTLSGNPIITSPPSGSISAEQTELEESTWWLNTSQQINTESALDYKDESMKYKIRHIDSGELAWWQRNKNEDDTLADEQLNTLNQEDTECDEKTASSSVENSWWINNDPSENLIKKAKDCNEGAWWLRNDEITKNPINEGNSSINNTDKYLNETESKTWFPKESTTCNLTNGSSSNDYYLSEPAWVKHSLCDSNKNSNIRNNNSLPEIIPLNNIKRIESGERPWWINETSSPNQKSNRSNKSSSYDNNSSLSKPPLKPNDVSEVDISKQTSSQTSSNVPWWMQSESPRKLSTIKRADSGERAWWLQDPEEKEKLKSPVIQSMHNYRENDCNDSNDDDDDDDGDADDDEIRQVTITLNKRNKNEINHCDNNSFHFKLSKSRQQNMNTPPPPLGDRASPEGLEDDSSKSRKSPYDNIPSKNNEQNLGHQEQLKENKKSIEKLFISRLTNIDDLLGGSCRPLSPLLDRFSAKSVFLEEITPAQVRIHDSTAQNAIIQRMDRDDWNYSESTSDFKEQNTLDDAALQIYKDGDFGAYLDLESSLAEQSEEIEGLNSSRKNAIVVRTQLSVRVHSIIEKLLSSEGSELRRALFSLKQVFQEDKDLVHGFVALGGLNCLVRVGNGADQNYQNYILRALGQVMLYVDGMNGVMKHGPTIQWLYSLISSKYRLVVKTALKLLLVFVEYTENNCYLLVNAIHAVDTSRAVTPWTNIMRLLKDYENADTELLIYATSLINKTLSGLSDQDSFYDESDLLEQQGMEGVIQRYMSRPGTDLDLLDQLQLYEAVLKFEDGETEGIFLSDNSVRKTLRLRQSCDSVERRKSRRHSSGISPQQPSPQKKLMQPSNGILDEDSSSSSNSNEFNGGVFRECKGLREGAGVTPGLRRRRERAERQKSFMREQLEAAVANGQNRKSENDNIEMDETNQLKNLGDCSPEILNSTNNRMKEKNAISSPLMSSSSKSTLGSTSISVINGFNMKNQYVNDIEMMTKNGLPEPHESPAKKKSVIRSNSATVINGLIKNLQYNDNLNGSVTELSEHFGGQKRYQTNRYCNHVNHSKLGFKTSDRSSNIIKDQIINTLSQTKINGNQEINGNFYDTNHNSNNHVNNVNCLNNASNSNNSNKHVKSKNYPYNSSQIVNGNQVFNYNQGLVTHRTEANPEIRYNHVNSIPQTENKMQQIGVPQTTQLHQTVLPATSSQPTLNRPRPSELLIIPNLETITQQLTTTEINNNTNSNNNNLDKTNKSAPVEFLNGNSSRNNIGNISVGSPITTVIGGNSSPRILNGNAKLCGKELKKPEDEDKKMLLQLKRDQTVKDLTQKLSNLPTSPQEEKSQSRIGDMTGLISKAKEGLAKSKSRGDISRSSSVDHEIKKTNDPKKSENELHWEELEKNITRPLNLCDLDFTDLKSDDEQDVLAPRSLGGGIPPPPPPCGMPPPPMLANLMPPPPTNLVPPPMSAMKLQNQINNLSSVSDTNTIKKNKKTVKLFWKEVREDMIPQTISKTIWDELPSTNVDTQKLEHLFESRAKDLMIKKQQELNKSKEIIVLDHKRSNAINIAMTKLPPPRAIKAAILKMDATVVTREGIDKLMNMLPTDEEKGKIQEAQVSNPELPLGSAEQFLLTLSSISELAARLKLWAFKLDFENSEKEIAEPLMDLKQGIELLRYNKTFRCILSTLLSVGIFLNGTQVKGFQLEYLAKVPEVKDTVNKHSLLHHLCHIVMESSPDTTDLYSEIGPITRASKADFTDLAHNLVQLETECKASWDRLKLIAKHDCPPQLKQKLVDFLADCAERIILLQIVHRRVTNRYRKFLLWLGVPQHRIPESRPNEFCKIVSEFALEYRTTRERVHQQIEKKANHRERNKTRGKMIIDIPKFRTKEDRADAELKQLLGTPSPSMELSDGTLTWRRRRGGESMRANIKANEEFTDGDDEILESLVKTATKAANSSKTTPRERKRTRHADRKSLRRTLKNGLTEEEKQHVASLIKSY